MVVLIKIGFPFQFHKHVCFECRFLVCFSSHDLSSIFLLIFLLVILNEWTLCNIKIICVSCANSLFNHHILFYCCVAVYSFLFTLHFEWITLLHTFDSNYMILKINIQQPQYQRAWSTIIFCVCLYLLTCVCALFFTALTCMLSPSIDVCKQNFHQIDLSDVLYCGVCWCVRWINCVVRSIWRASEHYRLQIIHKIQLQFIFRSQIHFNFLFVDFCYFSFAYIRIVAVFFNSFVAESIIACEHSTLNVLEKRERFQRKRNIQTDNNNEK